MGYKTWSENSCAVRASKPANEKHRLASPIADSPPKTLFSLLFLSVSLSIPFHPLTHVSFASCFPWFPILLSFSTHSNHCGKKLFCSKILKFPWIHFLLSIHFITAQVHTFILSSPYNFLTKLLLLTLLNPLTIHPSSPLHCSLTFLANLILSFPYSKFFNCSHDIPDKIQTSL